MESRDRNRTAAKIFEEIFTDDNSSLSPDSETDELEFKFDYDANWSSDGREEHQRRLNEKDERNEAPSSTTLYDIPLEMLDIILLKCYLNWVLKSQTKQSDPEVIRSLISVDVCFFRRITRHRFKKEVRRYLKEFYGKSNKISAIIRNNRNFLLENIQPSEEFIASLLSLNCVTKEQSHFIQQQRSTQDKNAELLYVMTSFDEKTFSNFAKSLRRTNQNTVARIMENGGGVIKIEVQTRGAKYSTSMETELLHQKIEDLRNRTRPRSHQTEKLISQLKDEGIEILNSHLDRQTVVVWIWCQSQAAVEHIQILYESNRLKDLLFENVQPSLSMVISIDRNQFKKTVLVCPISIQFTRRIEIPENELVWEVTKLRNEIYVLCQSRSSYTFLFRVFEDQNSFCLQKKIEIDEIKYPVDIVSSEKENCLYIADLRVKCVWKVTTEINAQHKIIEWLTTDYFEPLTLSVSNDGQLLVVYESSSILMIYGSDAEIIRSIRLPRDIEYPCHAVETSIGNFIILHWWWERKDKRESGSSGGKMETGFGISEVTRDGQMVIRRFIPSNKTEVLNDPRYLSIDSDDRVFVADTGNERVILLDPHLKWNRILCPTYEERRIQTPLRLCYDVEKKQLIAKGEGVSVYTLTRI